MSEKVKILRTMTAKEIMGVTGKDSVAKEQWMKHAKAGFEPLFHIAGDVQGYGMKHTTNGEQTFLLGIFLGRNNVTGQLFRSTKVYLPSKGDSETIVAMFKTGRETDKDFILGFTYEYNVEESDKSPTGYTYVGSPERSPEQVTREAELIGRMKALPAPKAAKK
jgi:ABC-type Fe3+-hydroxamate transport system substrate-binding protein